MEPRSEINGKDLFPPNSSSHSVRNITKVKKNAVALALKYSNNSKATEEIKKKYNLQSLMRGASASGLPEVSIAQWRRLLSRKQNILNSKNSLERRGRINLQLITKPSKMKF